MDAATEGGRAAATPVPPGFFGVNGQSLRPLAGTASAPLLDKQLAAIETGGLSFVRTNFDWRQLEPAPPRRGRRRFDFRSADAWVGALAEHHLRWYVVAIGVPTPRWATRPATYAVCGYRSPPDRLGAFTGLARGLAARYGRGGSFWRAHPDLPREPVRDFEIWNEPNFGAFWCPRPQPARYADMLTRSAEAVHAGDPSARVVLGGLAGFRRSGRAPGGSSELSPADFLAAVLRARPLLRHRIDVVGVHSYERDPREVLRDVRSDRRALASFGMARTPMSLNETGWYTAGIGATPPVSERRRAHYLRSLTAAIAVSGCGVVSFAPFVWTSAESNVARPDDWYGLASPETAEPYPSGSAYLDEVGRIRAGEGGGDPLAARRLCAGRARGEP